ncbi:MAG: serine--tRNA ligase [Dehalococcoidia bacterium]|nr:MAG: serine--tRNA ligase [Dehalococcoidia bacterium]
MLSIQVIRERTDDVRRALANRRSDAPLDAILAADERRRGLLVAVEWMRKERNDASKAIGAAKDPAERQRLIEAQRAVASGLDAREVELRELDTTLQALLLQVPNIPHPDVPLGGEPDAVIVLEGDGRDGSQRRVDPPVPVHSVTNPAVEADRKPHWEIGVDAGYIDFERGTKVSGSPFYFLRGDGARLQRALISWMLDVHRGQGYEEIYPPFLVREAALVGTGQLPKFANTMFRAEGTDLWLIPTAEVPVTNMYRDEILEAQTLPLHHVAYTACFRHEQFSAGRDVRGIKRGFQFDKVEMVQFVEENDSWNALERLLGHAVEIVAALGLRYRVIRLASGDLTFASAMTYDIEVWAPGAQEWLEVSSVSNFLDFQARRANLRYRGADGKVRFLHTLNGSGVALPRTLAAILETHALEDGSVELPAPLRPYLGGQAALQPPK